MNKRVTVIGLFALLAAFPASPGVLRAEDQEKLDAPKVEEIVQKTNRTSYYQGKDGRAKVSMTITDSKGRERTREFIILRRNEPPPESDKEKGGAYMGDQKFYVYFRRPADVNKMVFLVWKHVDERPDDRWLYMPALDLVKRIAATDKRTSFVGSNFFYEDVSGRNLTDDRHELVEVTKTYYVLKNTPIKPDEVEFSYFKMWVHKGTFLPIKTEYYDKKGEKYRVYELLAVKKIQDFQTVIKSRMKDLRTGKETVLEYSDVGYNQDLPENIFTERYLRRAPAKYLK